MNKKFREGKSISRLKSLVYALNRTIRQLCLLYRYSTKKYFALPNNKYISIWKCRKHDVRLLLI